MTEPILVMLPYDNRPKTVTISAELAAAYVALLRATEEQKLPNADLRHAIAMVFRAGEKGK
jgi:hypothetical protein